MGSNPICGSDFFCIYGWFFTSPYISFIILISIFIVDILYVFYTLFTIFIDYSIVFSRIILLSLVLMPLGLGDWATTPMPSSLHKTVIVITHSRLEEHTRRTDLHLIKAAFTRHLTNFRPAEKFDRTLCSIFLLCLHRTDKIGWILTFVGGFKIWPWAEHYFSKLGSFS